MKKKIIMTIALCICLSTMLLPWFGGLKGVQEIQGYHMLNNPIAVTCIILSFIGIWTNFGRNSDIIGSIGFIGIIGMEIYELLTWHILTITGYFDIALSLSLAYSEFWFAFACTIITYIGFKFMNRNNRLYLD